MGHKVNSFSHPSLFQLKRQKKFETTTFVMSNTFKMTGPLGNSKFCFPSTSLYYIYSLYFLKAPFEGLSLEGFIFREAHLWREICVSKSIGLVLQLEGNLPFFA